MENNLSLGEKIKVFRKRTGLTQLELELAIDASPGSVSRIENGEVNPTKETLTKISEVLNLSTYDAAELFNINIKSELLKFTKIHHQLNEEKEVKDILDAVVTKLIAVLNVTNASIWLWDDKEKLLRLYTFSAPEIAKSIIKQALGKPLKQITLDPKNEKALENISLQSILQEKIIKTNLFTQVTIPFLNDAQSKLVQMLAGIKLAVAVPLIVKGIKLGSLNIAWRRDDITENDYFVLQTFANQIAFAIHNVEKYEELETRYKKLQLEVNKLKYAK